MAQWTEKAKSSISTVEKVQFSDWKASGCSVTPWRRLVVKSVWLSSNNCLHQDTCWSKQPAHNSTIQIYEPRLSCHPRRPGGEEASMTSSGHETAVLWYMNIAFMFQLCREKLWLLFCWWFINVKVPPLNIFLHLNSALMGVRVYNNPLFTLPKR